MLKRTQPKRRSRQRGLSLVELMIGILVGLILIAGMIQLFVANKQAYRLQEDLVVQEENARYSLQTLGYDLRMAGHWGGVPVGDLTDRLGMSGCEQALIKDRLEDISGFEGGVGTPASFAAAATCGINAGDYVDNSDVIVMRFAAVDQRVAADALDSTENNDRPFIGSIAGFGGFLDEGSDLKTAEESGGKLYDASKSAPREGVYNFPLYTAAYFIRPCSVKAGAQCAATDDGGDPIPTLTRLVLRGSSLIQEAVAEGVEQMQVEYGVGDLDGNISEYKDADDMNTSDWDNVSAVRIGLLVRSNKQDGAFEDVDKDGNLKQYQMPGNDDATDNHTVPDSGKHYRRKLVTQVMRIRNKGKS